MSSPLADKKQREGDRKIYWYIEDYVNGNRYEVVCDPQEKFLQVLAKAKRVSGIDIQGLAYAPDKAAYNNNEIICDDESMKMVIQLAGEDAFTKDKGIHVRMVVA
jgi:hypothetical protein